MSYATVKNYPKVRFTVTFTINTKIKHRHNGVMARRKNPMPIPLKQTITVGNNGRQTISNDHDTEELKEPADTPAGYVTSNQQSNLANLQKIRSKSGTENWNRILVAGTRKN